MSKKKRKTKILCPQCGAEFAIGKKEFTTVATVVGEDSNLGSIYLAMAGQNIPVKPLKSFKTVQERIEALRNVGVDVSHMFAMEGANGGGYIASNRNGILSVLEDDDPIFNQIVEQGTVPNNRLFRRWIMAKMFYMMTYKPYRSKEPLGVTRMMHRLGYEYKWKMLLNELYAQMKMEDKDAANFVDRNRWFNVDVVMAMAEDYIVQLKKYVDALKERKCKGVPYKRIKSRNIFKADLQNKIYYPLYKEIAHIKQARNVTQLYNAAKKFNDMRLKMPHDTPQSKTWVDAYKGAGAYYTMQNLIRFHNCKAIDDTNNRLDKYQSLAFITAKAEMYRNDEGWRLLAVLKKMLTDNNIDISKKMAEWRK